MCIRKLNADEIECRVATIKSNGCSLLLYKTARVDRAILDEHFGAMNWQNDFKVIDGKMYGGIGVRDDLSPQWVWKWDCGTESNTEKEKGEASDCFKRAGFKWGIGVELYTAPFIWINCEVDYNSEKRKYSLKGNPTFSVQKIGYGDKGDINELEIIDNKKNLVYKMGTFIKNQEKKLSDEDIDLFEGLKACSDMKMLADYFKENVKYVKDQKGFIKIKNEMKEKFSKGA